MILQEYQCEDDSLFLLVDCDYCGTRFIEDEDGLLWLAETGQEADRYLYPLLSPSEADEDDMFSIDGNEGLICDWCREDLQGTHGALTIRSPEGVLSLGVCSRYAWGQSADGEEPNWELLGDALEILRGRYYHRTDAWRGAYLGPNETEHWVEATGGWHSTMEQSDLSDTIHAIMSGEIVVPFPVAVLIGLTSNVCSVTWAVYVHKENVEALRKLLEEKTPAPAWAQVR